MEIPFREARVTPKERRSEPLSSLCVSCPACQTITSQVSSHISNYHKEMESVHSNNEKSLSKWYDQITVQVQKDIFDTITTTNINTNNKVKEMDNLLKGL